MQFRSKQVTGKQQENHQQRKRDRERLSSFGGDSCVWLDVYVCLQTCTGE